MGNIGAAIARRGRLGFNMPIIYSGNSRKTELEQELGAQFRSLDQLLAEADFVCLVAWVSTTSWTKILRSTRTQALMATATRTRRSTTRWVGSSSCEARSGSDTGLTIEKLAAASQGAAAFFPGGCAIRASNGW